jgi:hypothetical protein
MPNDRRYRNEGASTFFAVNLHDRRSNMLVAEIESLRIAVKTTRAKRPFHIDAWVVLPNHMHCLGPSGQTTRLPRPVANDQIAIVARSRHRMTAAAPWSTNANAASGNAITGNTPSATTTITPHTWIISTSIR